MAEKRHKARHTSELALDKCSVTLRPTLDAKYKIIQKYGRPGEGLREALLRAIEAITSGVKLTAASLAEVEREMQANYEKRMLEREKRGLAPRRNLKDYSRFEKKTSRRG